MSGFTRRQCLQATAGAWAAPARRPNVLIVLADQYPAYATGYNGDPYARTPHLDRMSREGARFPNAVSNCPVCTPYRAMLQTARWPLATGMIANDIHLSESEYTLGEAFRDAGYETAYIGKWHLDGPERWAFTPPGARRQGYGFWAVNNCNHNYLNAYYYRDTPERIPVRGYEPVAQTDLLCEFIRNRRRDKPFFAMLSWGPPHPPYGQIPQELHVFRPGQIRPRPNMQNPNPEFLADFYSHIAALDTQLGRILAVLEQGRIAADTVVLFTSDHGDMLGSHGKWDKQIWYEESVNVPFVLRYPRRVRGGLAPQTLVNAVDVMPTLLGLAGIVCPSSVQGRDVFINPPSVQAALIAGYMPFARQAFEYPEWRGVRTATHTYVETRQGAWELFDNVGDPYQMTNLVNLPAHAAVQAQLANRLRALLAATGDRFDPRESYWKRYNLDIADFGQVRYRSRPAQRE